MAKRPPCPPGSPWLVPYLTVRDADKALDFYQRAFGFEKRAAMPGPDGRTMHAEMVWRGALLMFGPECTVGSTVKKAPITLGVESPMGLYIYCDDVDALCDRARKAGATINAEPQDMFWGDRMCRLTDPDGHNWSFATNVADFDPSKDPFKKADK